MCKAGYEPSSDPEGICTRCKEGTFKPHKGDKECEECPWPKTTEKSGSITSDTCGELLALLLLQQQQQRQQLLSPA